LAVDSEDGFEGRRSEMSEVNNSEPRSRVLSILESEGRTKDLVTRDRIPHSPPILNEVRTFFEQNLE
jgi:hypothetical protein